MGESITLEQILSDINAAAEVLPDAEPGDVTIEQLAEAANISSIGMKARCKKAERQGLGRVVLTRQGNVWRANKNPAG